MKKNLHHLLRGFGLATSFGMLSMLWMAAPVSAQSADKAPAAAPEAKDKEKPDQNKDTPTPAAKPETPEAKDAKTPDVAPAKADKDAPKKDAPATASDNPTEQKKQEPAQNADKPAPQAKPDRDAPEKASEATRETRDRRDTAQPSTREPARGARDSARDAADRENSDRDASDRDESRAPRSSDRDAASRDRDADRPSREPRDRRDADDRRDTRERSTERESRDVRDSERETDVRRDARDRRDSDTRDVRRDSEDSRDVRRESSRDVRRESSRTSRSETRSDFDVSTFRSADMGLWFRASDNGLVIRDVASSGPITRLGFHEGDQIVSVNGQRVTRERDFVTYLFAEDVREERVKVIVLREGREEVVWVEPVVFIEESYTVNHDPLEEFGIIVDDRYDDQIVVLRVFPRSPAYYAGIRKGDVITVFNGRRVSAPQQFVELVREVDSESVSVKVNRDRQVRDLDVEFTSVERRSSVRDQDVERRYDRREQRIERRDDRSDRGARIDVDAQRDGAPRVNVETNGSATTPRVDVDVQAPRGGLLPRVRGR